MCIRRRVPVTYWALIVPLLFQEDVALGMSAENPRHSAISRESNVFISEILPKRGGLRSVMHRSMPTTHVVAAVLRMGCAFKTGDQVLP